MLTDAQLVKRLEPPQGRIDMVLDTDTFNEVDDQFALIYSLLSPEKLHVEAIYAAPFYNARSSDPEDGMEKSYEEILRLLDRMQLSGEGFVFRGSRGYLPSKDAYLESLAVNDLIARAMDRSEDNPLYVVAIGAITNVACALLKRPQIADKIVVVWLGGHGLEFPNANEFNLKQDVTAVNVVLNSRVPFVIIPCYGVASHLLTSIPEIKETLYGKNAICDTLVELFSAHTRDPFAWGKEIWDVATIAYLLNSQWVPSKLISAPFLTEDCHWVKDATRHPIRIAYHLYRNPIFKDMFKKMITFEIGDTR